MDGFSYPFFIQFYAMTKAARAYAEVHLRELQATEAVRSGDMERATREIVEARTELSANKAAYEATLAELSGEPWVIRPEDPSGYRWTGRPESELLDPDWGALFERLDTLEANKDRLYQEYNVPAWFKDWFAKRGLVAAKADGSIEVDGTLSEPAWKLAQAVDQLVGHRQYKVMSVPAEVRLLYDGTHLYLGARLTQPLIGGIAEPKRGADEYVFTEQVELLLVTADGTLHQFVVDTAGNLFTMRQVPVPQGAAQTTEGWESGATTAVRRTTDGWSLELAVPLESLGESPGNAWRAVMARDLIVSLEPRQVETFAAAFFNGESCHTTELHSPLRFAAKPLPPVTESPGLHVVNPTMKTRTTQRGAGSELLFDVVVETRHPLREVAIRAEVLDREGDRLAQTEVTRKDTVALKYSTPRPICIQLDNEQAGVKLRVSLAYRTLDGEHRSTEKTIVLGDAQAALRHEEIFAGGVTPGTKAVAAPVHFPTEVGGKRLLSFDRGTIEIWLRPQVDMAAPAEQWGERFLYLFHYGPQLDPDRESPSRNSLTIVHEKKGWISFSLSNLDGDRRLVHSPLPDWSAGEWHHVACVWDLSADGKCRLELYLDGKQSARNLWGRKGGVEDRTPMAMQDGAYVGQLGSLNSRRRVAEARFDDLKIWRTPHYDADFVPSRPARMPPVEGSLYFGFEGNFLGRFRLDGDKGTVLGGVGVHGG